jgi:hypothetical protein
MSKSSKFAPKTYESFLLGYDSNSRAYRIFNMTTSCVETTCDVVFDETNGSQNEQVDLDLVDDEEAPYDALQRMMIGDIRPQDLSNQPQQSQRSSAQLVGDPERQLEVSGSIPQWDEFRASLKKSPRCASSTLGYLCLFATMVLSFIK